MATQTGADAEQGAVVPGHGEDPSAHAVDAAFQIGFVVKLALAVACGSILAGVVAYAVLAKDLGSYAQNPAIISGVQGSVLTAAALSALIQVAVTGLIVTVLALFASHRIAGPTIRLVRLLRGVSDGRLPGHVRFRQGDQTGRLESRFNEVSRLLSERHELLTHQLEVARSAERELRQALAKAGAGGESLAAARRLREEAGVLARRLAAIAGEPGADPSD